MQGVFCNDCFTFRRAPWRWESTSVGGSHWFRVVMGCKLRQCFQCIAPNLLMLHKHCNWDLGESEIIVTNNLRGWMKTENTSWHFGNATATGISVIDLCNLSCYLIQLMNNEWSFRSSIEVFITQPFAYRFHLLAVHFSLYCMWAILVLPISCRHSDSILCSYSARLDAVCVSQISVYHPCVISSMRQDIIILKGSGVPFVLSFFLWVSSFFFCK